MAEDVLVKDLLARFEGMKSEPERANFESNSQEVRAYIRPEAQSFSGRDTPGRNNRQKVLDNTTEVASDALAGALNGFLSNPGQKWFGIRAKRRRLNRIASAARWLELARDLMQSVFESPGSQFTTQILPIYQDTPDFGIGCLYVADRPGRLPLYQARPMAEMLFAQNDEGVIDTAFRDFELTARQAARTVGKDRLPEKIATAIAANKTEQRFPFLHAVFPRPELRRGLMGASSLPFASIWVSRGDQARVRESGFHEFPFVAPRWQLRANEVYGRGPGIKALADVKMLQRAMAAQIRGVEKLIDPPLIVADDGVLTPVMGGPKNVNIVRAEMTNGRRPLIEPFPSGARPDVGDVFLDGIRGRIERTYFNHLIELVRDPRMTATHVLKLDEQSLRQIGPYLGRMQNELLGGAIERSFGILFRAGILPPPPEELEGEELEVEYVSPIAKAQRLSEVSAYGTLMEVTAPLVAADQEVLDNLDRDFAFRDIGDRLGVPKDAFKDPNEVERIRAGRAELAEQAIETEQLERGAAAAQSAGQAAAAFKNAGGLKRAA